MSNELPTLTCSFTSEDLLYLAYMPFVKGGGVFIRTKESYKLGAPVTLSIKLMDDATSYTTEGKIVWLTPKGAQGNKPAGVGVQFIGEDSHAISNKIETYLAGMLKSTQMTDTI